ncbi:hypothetical protein HS088_TW17G00496 [Tripterygium wilfordii]|uniref:Pentatricopeptide repeat-containing protein n=1 Tax=Tripterygium wilfordii TaxID=458696 RepID=A0A7J7CFQ5_TRIWF|nr:uncharacterized protein LOC119982247 [Tripterygium wilfordii]KAF5732963.1 hypothetical protein HS088_TW17G00496 [Tripterygium wilfordii]
MKGRISIRWLSFFFCSLCSLKHLPSSHSFLLILSCVGSLYMPIKWRVKVQNAYAAFQNMRRAGLEPSDKCVALVLRAYEKENKLGMALAFLMDLEKSGIIVGKEASEVLARWFGRLGLVKKVEFVLRAYAAGENFVECLLPMHYSCFVWFPHGCICCEPRIQEVDLSLSCSRVFVILCAGNSCENGAMSIGVGLVTSC